MDHFIFYNRNSPVIIPISIQSDLIRRRLSNVRKRAFFLLSHRNCTDSNLWIRVAGTRSREYLVRTQYRKKVPAIRDFRDRARSGVSRSTYMRQEKTSSCAVCISCTCIHRVNNNNYFWARPSLSVSKDVLSGGRRVRGILARTPFRKRHFISALYSPRNTWNFCNIYETPRQRFRSERMLTFSSLNSTFTHVSHLILS